MKTFSYAQITRATEEALQQYLKQSAESDRDEMRDVFGCMADGAFYLWDRLTHGFQNKGDRDRMRLIKEGQMELPF